MSDEARDTAFEAWWRSTDVQPLVTTRLAAKGAWDHLWKETETDLTMSKALDVASKRLANAQPYIGRATELLRHPWPWPLSKIRQAEAELRGALKEME